MDAVPIGADFSSAWGCVVSRSDRVVHGSDPESNLKDGVPRLYLVLLKCATTKASLDIPRGSAVAT